MCDLSVDQQRVNQLDSEQFKIDRRAGLKRFGIFKTHFEAKTREELKSSSIAPDGCFGCFGRYDREY